MKAVVLGGTKGMGRALARQLVEQGAEVFLLGRDLEDLSRSAADLEQRGGGAGKVGFTECDLADVEQFEAALATAETALGGLDTIVVTAGLFGTQEQLESDPALTHWMLDLNFTKTILFCEVARKRLLSLGGGTLVVFSSVAGERARKPVVLYGAAKAGLSAYLEGLDHKYRGDGLKTICVKPGFVKTSMTEGLPAPPFAGNPEQVAIQVARAIGKGTPVVYTPSIWALIMLVIRHLPRLVMRRIGF
jgi:NAD(P)-dependent dehydrogenase (short-subunit alcohol dehydrogenase family)